MANVDGRNETLRHGLLQWLRNPSNWLSLGSIVISTLTLLYVQFYPGTVTIYMPKLLGLSAPTGATWRFIVSASLFNEAPSTKIMIIEDATLYVRIANAATHVQCPWRGTTELMTTAEYRTRFGEPDPGNEQYPDQVAPFQRTLPFAIRGGELQTKMLVFDCPQAFALGSADSVPVEATLKVMTSTETHTSKKRGYQLYETARMATENRSWTWIE